MVPEWGMVFEYMVKAATGHPTTPKGGTPEYRNGPWYKSVYGVPQGKRLGRKQQFGYGAYSSKKMRFVTIEQTWTAIKKWYDVELQNTNIANPARNERLQKVRQLLGLRHERVSGLGIGFRVFRVGVRVLDTFTG